MSSQAQAPQAPEADPGRSRLILGVLLLVAFGLRFLRVFDNGASPYFDEPIMDPLYHLQWAQAFAEGETFREGPFFRAPLYPWFLGSLLKVSGGSLFFVYTVQALLGTLSVGLVHAIARRLFGSAAALWAAGLVAINWVLIYFSGELLIPALSIPLTLAALLFTHRIHDAEERSGQAKLALLAGLFWGLSAIARPNVLLLMPFLFGWILWSARPRWQGAIKTALALTLGTLIPILPITAYNTVAGGDMVLISSQGGVNFWIGNNPQSDGSTAIVPGTRPGWWEGFHDSISLAEQAEGRTLKPSEVSQHYSSRAVDFFLEEPGEALAHLGWKLRLLVANWELGNNADVHFFAHHFSPWMGALPPSLSLLLPLALIGLFVHRKGSRRPGASNGEGASSPLFPLWSFLLVYGGSIVLFFVCSRFRTPLLPVLAIPAGAALSAGVANLRARAWKGPAIGVLVFSVLAALISIKPPGVDSSGAQGHWALGIAEMRQDNAAAAKAHFQAALDTNPRSLYALRDMARAQKSLGELLDASESFRKALELKPDDHETRSEWVDLLIARGELPQAATVADQGLRASPDFATSYDARARVHTALLEWAPAIEVLKAGLEREPTHFYANLRLGAILHQTGDPCGALPYLKAAANHPAPPMEGIREQAASLVQVCESDCGGG